MTTPLVLAEELSVSFSGASGDIPAVRQLSFEVGREKLGIVGESGSGKSTCARALLGLLSPNATVSARRLEFDGISLLDLPQSRLSAIRGKRAAIIVQDPKFSLNPVLCVGAQIAEAYRLHHGLSQRDAKVEALSGLEQVQLRDPERIYQLYPHQCSGGIGQRAMIAMALAGDPDLLIADEATSALDKTVQLEILKIIDSLAAKRNMGVIFVSHDLGLVGRFCDRVMVMYGGRAVDNLAAAELATARHSYTRALLSAQPLVHAPRDRLPTLDRALLE